MAKNKTALVTGGGKGLGKAIAEGLAAQGWDLILVGRDETALNQTATEIASRHQRHQINARTLRADFSDPDSTGIAKKLLADIPLPDALVCNAGNYGTLGSLATVDFAQWKLSFDLNFFATAALIQRYVQLWQHCQPALAAERPSHRRKILVMSGNGLGGSKVWPATSSYGCAKAALYRLVEIVHEEVYSQGIDINCIAPGAVKTGMTEQGAAAGAALLGALHASTLKVLESGGDSPLLAAEAAATLLSPSCDGVSGRLISAKWDKTALSRCDSWKNDPDFFRLRRIDNDLFKSADRVSKP